MKKILLLPLLACMGNMHANAQVINTIAGNGVGAYSGDGGLATAAKMYGPMGVAADASGNVYIADSQNGRIRKVNKNDSISTVAGNGTFTYAGDGGQATAAGLWNPAAVALDASGNLYIADQANSAIRKVTPAGVITTVAGTGTAGYTGEGGPATAADLNSPSGVAVDASGNIYIACSGSNRIEEVTGGNIHTIAGNSLAGYFGDNGQATAAKLDNPYGVAVDASGNVYIADETNQCVRKINTSGVITTIAGTGTAGYNGSGIAAVSAELKNPSSVAVDASGNLFIADNSNNRIRIVQGGMLYTYAGNGTSGYNNDGISATSAEISAPSGVATDGLGNVYIADFYNNRVRIVSCKPLVTITGLSAICQGTSTNLFASGAFSYKWSANASNSTNSQVKVSPAVDTTYVVTGKDITGCSAKDSVTVTVNPLPSITSSISSATTCAGSADTLKVSGTSYYNWSANAGNATTSKVTVFPAVSDTYTVIGTDNNGCTDTNKVSVTVNSLPVVVATANRDTMCQGIADTINASGALNYVWSPGGATSGSVSINPAATQTYTVTGIDGNGCKNTGTVKVVVINCITGIEQNVSNNDEVRVYPSPSNGKITIENIKDHQFSNADIYNVEGEKVYSFTPSAHTVIDLTTLPSGVYFLQLKGDKITITKKLVITK